MRRLILVLAALLAAPAAAQPAPPSAVPAPDYRDPASWACRPGAEDACTAKLDAVTVAADGTRTPDRFVAARDPAVDCFYVYPTVSDEQTPYADMKPSPEVMRTVRAQAGRLASRCRLFAPLYRQATLAHLHAKLAGGGVPNWDGPYRDVAAAWDDYLAHDNHGRGVVLVGHSQGTILLQRLIAERIDGKPAQALLVAAFLAGDPVLAVPPGQTVGGTFVHVPVCTALAETGCAYPWGSYLADDDVAHRVFGHTPGSGLVAACAVPAAPGGGSGMLESYFPRPALAPASDPDWVRAVGQLAVACRADAQGDVARVTIEPGRYADLLRATLGLVVHGGWGLHTLDIALMQGNMLDAIAAESAAWTKAHR